MEERLRDDNSDIISLKSKFFKLSLLIALKIKLSCLLKSPLIGPNMAIISSISLLLLHFLSVLMVEFHLLYCVLQ